MGVAVLLDWGGPALFGVDGWRLVPAHFAERHNLVIILALGESIVALGVGADVDLDRRRDRRRRARHRPRLGVVVGLLRRRGAGDRRGGSAGAAEGRDRNRWPGTRTRTCTSRWWPGSCSPPSGSRTTLAHVDEPSTPCRRSPCSAASRLYLLAHVALRLRNARTLNVQRLALAVALLALIPVATHVPALVTLAAVNVPLWAMIAYETARYGECRYRLRHGLDVEIYRRGS